ncbi:hypothetical protein P3H15_27230 [Rhodococcus sp. T2V]|uniref:hypothetical protein n=1 Tax=Rhodococcus sp. T2V TaxID=3034164 RepID=UPI0023E1FA5C|nr:hypothetical protein [Rhodococcus sp. T2V]MDF3308715.1 hypothetical protein [Rhodococcus sp. T2V]
MGENKSEPNPNFVTFTTEDGRTVSTAAGSRRHLEHLAEQKAKAEAVADETVPNAGAETETSNELGAADAPDTAAETGTNGRRARGSKVAGDTGGS